MTEKLMMAALGDVSGKVRGKGFPVASRDSRLRSGVGWTPTNVQITCFDSISDSPYGALGDLILRPAASTEVEVDFGAEAPSLHFMLGDVEYTDGQVWECCLRSMARAALDDLRAETGLTLTSAFEHEFMFKDDGDFGGAFSLRGFQERKAFGELFLSGLRQARMSPDTFLREYGSRQYEVTLDPAEGIAAADQATILRKLAHATASAKGEAITFTPLRSMKGVGNGCMCISASSTPRADRPPTTRTGRVTYQPRRAPSWPGS